jgi:Uncharacterized protein YfbK, C-terminal
MNAALLYRSRRRWLFWIALAFAVGIHVGAVVFAKGNSDKVVVQDLRPPGGEVELTYDETSMTSTSSNEMLTVKLRYKKPDENKSELIERAVTDTNETFERAPADLKFAAAVAGFGMILRDSEYKGNGTLDAVVEWAQQAKGKDPNGYRTGFIELVRKAQTLKRG